MGGTGGGQPRGGVCKLTFWAACGRGAAVSHGPACTQRGWRRVCVCAPGGADENRDLAADGIRENREHRSRDGRLQLLMLRLQRVNEPRYVRPPQGPFWLGAGLAPVHPGALDAWGGRSLGEAWSDWGAPGGASLFLYPLEVRGGTSLAPF